MDVSLPKPLREWLKKTFPLVRMEKEKMRVKKLRKLLLGVVLA
jgi:hypothetical protein